MIVNVKDYGAVADGKTIATKAFQTAIDYCAENGGGTVVVTPGKYYIGKIVLKDNITLDINAGAELIASSDIKNDYTPTKHYKGSIYTYLEEHGYYDESDDPRKEGIALIYAGSAENIRITGQGKINGNFKNILVENDANMNAALQGWRNYIKGIKIYSVDRSVSYFRRPVGIFLEDCHNVIIDSITLFDSSMYAMNLRGCSDVEISGVKVHNCIGADNADGFHFSSCNDVNINNCVLKCGDDCIAIDSNEQGTPSRRFQINNCTFDSRNNCFRIFTSLSPHIPRREAVIGGIVSDIVINNCTVERASSFAFIHADEGNIERVSISNATGNISLLGTVFLIVAHNGKVKNITLNNWNFESNGVGYIYSNIKDGVSDVNISGMLFNVFPKTKIYGNGFHMPTMSERGYEGQGNKPVYFLSHYAPYFLQITNAKNINLSNVIINWGEAEIEDINEVKELYHLYKGVNFPEPWESIPCWSAVFVENSENISAYNLECEPYGDAERITVINSINVNL